MIDQSPSGVGWKECGCGTELTICPVNMLGGVGRIEPRISSKVSRCLQILQLKITDICKVN